MAMNNRRLTVSLVFPTTNYQRLLLRRSETDSVFVFSKTDHYRLLRRSETDSVVGRFDNDRIISGYFFGPTSCSRHVKCLMTVQWMASSLPCDTMYLLCATNQALHGRCTSYLTDGGAHYSMIRFSKNSVVQQQQLDTINFAIRRADAYCKQSVFRF